MYWPMYRKTAPSLSSSASSRCLGTEQFSDTSANTFRVTLLPVAGNQPLPPSPWRGCLQATQASELHGPALPRPEELDPMQKAQHENDYDYATRSFVPLEAFFTTQHVSQPVAAAYCHTLVRAGFNYPRLRETCTNFQPPEPLNEGEPPETLYGHLLGCLREISFERYPSIVTDGIDHQ